ncbi:MAG: transporter substrate-binding domain-containing protein [Rhodoferax sp.]
MNATRLQTFWLSALLGLFGGAAPVGASVLLTTHDLPPYSFKGPNGQPEGLAVQVALCAFAQMNIAARIEFYPWKRAQFMVEKGEAVGFLAASQASSRDEFAVLSAAIAPQQWVWFQLQSHPLTPGTTDFKTQAQTSSFLGANMQDWLQDEGYRTTAAPRLNSMLLEMLRHRRIDAILANRLVMEKLLKEEQPSQPSLRATLALDKPLGIYVSKRFLSSQNSNFMPRLDAAIARCGAKN